MSPSPSQTTGEPVPVAPKTSDDLIAYDAWRLRQEGADTYGRPATVVAQQLASALHQAERLEDVIDALEHGDVMLGREGKGASCVRRLELVRDPLLRSAERDRRELVGAGFAELLEPAGPTLEATPGGTPARISSESRSSSASQFSSPLAPPPAPSDETAPPPASPQPPAVQPAEPAPAPHEGDGRVHCPICGPIDKWPAQSLGRHLETDHGYDPDNAAELVAALEGEPS